MKELKLLVNNITDKTKQDLLEAELSKRDKPGLAYVYLDVETRDLNTDFIRYGDNVNNCIQNRIVLATSETLKDIELVDIVHIEHQIKTIKEG